MAEDSFKTSEMSLQEELCEGESGTGKKPVSPVTSNVSLKSDRSLPVGPNFKGESDPQESGNGKRPVSPVTSCVSFKSAQSMGEPPNLKEGSAPQDSGTAERPNSPGSSCVSFKSAQSMGEPPKLKEGSVPQDSRTTKRPISPESSCASFKSAQSKGELPTFKEGSVPQDSATLDMRESIVSCKSDQSMDLPFNFRDESDPVQRTSKKTPGSPSPSQKPLKQNQRSNYQQRDQMSQSAETGDKPQKHKDFFNVFNDLEDKMIVFIKHELEMYKKLLRKENTNYYRKVKQIRWNLKQTVLSMTLSFLNLMSCENIASALQNELIGIIQRPLKEVMKNKYHHVSEGIAKQGESTSLNKIYTDLYITEGGAGHVNKEHEVRRIEKDQTQEDVQIECKNMFELLPEQERPIRTVLTQGVAGVGKSICVQKFILDWAEGKEHRDIQFIFPLPFRELNLKKGHHSLMDIISFFFPETEGLILTDQNKVMFIFDGLDECKLPLSFHKNEILKNVCEAASLDVVLTNLIKGNLLPSALIWITTRPAAASRIPAECVDRVSEVRGFNDQQKEQYFRKNISDQDLANNIIDHIKQSRSLFIMCHIPVFCWISATVLQKILKDTETEETPKTLTNMYTCFLIFQAVQGNVKYTGKNALDIPWDKEAILALGKLAFQQLEKNNLIFYAAHLDACGIDPSKISVYSGLCTQETGRFLGTVFSFVHLSIQEFIAAVFAYLSLRNDNRNVFEPQSTSQESKTTELIDFLKAAVDKALESEHGNLDLFLRFLLGLSLESNHELIRGLLTQTESRSDCQKEIVEYIKLKFRENPSPERSINLFYCLNELNDDSLVKEIQSYMSSGRLSEMKLSPAQWSALVFVLLTSKEELDVFDLKKFIRSDECLNRLLPVVQEATSALLSDCNLTERSCSALLKVLGSESSTLTLLDLSNNPIQDCGVELLSEGLKSSNCKLEKLSLSFCSITGRGYGALSSALNPSSPLIELDLSGNDPGDTGVKIMTDLLQDTTYKLNKLRLLRSADAEEVRASLTESLETDPLLLTELDLSDKLQGYSEIKKLSHLLAESHCRTKKLKLIKNSITEEGCAALSSALCLNPSHMIELDLSDNKLGNSGVMKLCELLGNQFCKLQILRIADCCIKEEGYVALASVLKSNSTSTLTELDLRGNDPGDTGVQLLFDLETNENSKLKTLRLLKTAAAEEACAALTKELGTNPLLLKEMDLKGKIREDSGLKQLSELLKDQHCRTKKLRLNNGKITEKGCEALSAALRSNPSHLIELDLSKNKLGNSGVKEICGILENANCGLQKLDLSFGNISEQGYIDLESAVKSNSSLIELVLRGNDPGETGVKRLNDILQDLQHKLSKLRLLKSHAVQDFCDSLTKALGTNPLLLTELDLTGKIQGDSAVQQLSDILEDLHCRTRILKLSNSDVTEEGCAALSAALCSNPSHLIELDLSGNKLGNSGLKQLFNIVNKQHSKLQKLSVSDNNITEEGYAALVSALKSNPSSKLTELDLRGNDPGDTGVKRITELQKEPNCKLETLRLLKSPAAEKAFHFLVKALETNPLLLTELILSERNFKDLEMKQMTDLLKDSHCRPKKLTLKSCGITEEGCSDLSAALCSNPSHLIELDLSGNKMGNHGVKQFCGLLENDQFKLSKLQLCDCEITDEGSAFLTSALKSNPSHLRELELSNNRLGDSGVQQLIDLLQNSNCTLEKLKLKSCGITEEGCAALSTALSSNPSHLIELDLSGNTIGNCGVKEFSGLLENPQFTLSKLQLCDCKITDEGSAFLTSALKSNPSHLRELELSNNKVGDSGVQQLIDLLQNSNCTLKKLNLSFCSISEKGYSDLASALKSSSHLEELDLSGNDPGEKGVELLTALIEDPNCSLKTLRLLKTAAAKEACDYLTEILGNNPLLLPELDLSGKIKGDLGMKQLSDLLGDSHCRTEKLKLKSNCFTEKDCADLTKALRSNPSHLKELDLSGNKIENSGVKKISDLLKMAECKLTKLNISDCSVTEEGYANLVSALKSNSSLVELDLRGNDPGNKGVKLFTDLQEEPNCKLMILRLLNSSAAEEACASLSAALGMNVLLQTELNLSRNPAGLSGDSRVKLLCDLLQDKHCKLKKLQINNDDLTEESCSALATVLPSSSLRELNLSNNNLQNSGVKKLCEALKNPLCKLETLSLSSCSVAEDGYTALASALKENHKSHLKKLDFSGNDPGDKGVEQITSVFMNSKKTLRLLKSDAAVEACTSLLHILKQNPLLQRELDLSQIKPGQISVNQLSALLEDPHCRLQKLT
uniref:NACHT domain-containing protein n=1 Tax=Astyanax mexicanus TaxID=7994 RepID=A0A8B9HDD6_ASTMX